MHDRSWIEHPWRARIGRARPIPRARAAAALSTATAIALTSLATTEAAFGATFEAPADPARLTAPAAALKAHVDPALRPGLVPGADATDARADDGDVSLRLDSPAFWNRAPTRRPLATAFSGTQNDRPDQWDDSATDGRIAAVSYQLTETLYFGPGIGVMNEYQRRSTIFPVFLIDWQISDRLALTAGRGLGMRSGPGVASRGPVRACRPRTACETPGT